MLGKWVEIMSFETFSDFLAMGGHGLYVWLCYGVGFTVFIIAFLQPILKRKEIVKELQQAIRRAEMQKQE